MQALKEILDNALLLSKKLINMIYFIKEQTFLREYFESSFKFLKLKVELAIWTLFYLLYVYIYNIWPKTKWICLYCRGMEVSPLPHS